MMHASDIAPDAGVQYYALSILEEAKRRGFVRGSLPMSLLTNNERRLLREFARDKSGLHAHSNDEVAAAVMWACASLADLGYEFETDMGKIMGMVYGYE
jgi:uncharacterized protein (UPF0548 family)